MTERSKLIMEWLLANEDLLTCADIVKLKLDIKGTSVKGEITILTDSKK